MFYCSFIDLVCIWMDLFYAKEGTTPHGPGSRRVIHEKAESKVYVIPGWLQDCLSSRASLHHLSSIATFESTSVTHSDATRDS